MVARHKAEIPGYQARKEDKVSEEPGKGLKHDSDIYVARISFSRDASKI